VVGIVRAPEYRFVVGGEAISFRSPLAKAYKRTVRRAARGCVPTEPIGDPLEFRLDYFHSQRRRFDMDNVAKCVLDALNGVAYVDDRLARVQSATAHDLRRRFEIHGGPVDLVKPLHDYDDYLFVRIRVAG
jgi:Holliday junction resolvase RusA-like endonuclease